MKSFLNKTVHCEFDKLADGTYSAVDGVCLEMEPGFGVAIKHTLGDSTEQVIYIQDERITDFTMVVS